MFISIKMHKSLSWYHYPKDFSLVVNLGNTILDILELIGVEANNNTKVRINGKVVSWGYLVADGDKMEIFKEPLVGSRSDNMHEDYFD